MNARFSEVVLYPSDTTLRQNQRDRSCAALQATAPAMVHVHTANAVERQVLIYHGGVVHHVKRARSIVRSCYNSTVLLITNGVQVARGESQLVIICEDRLIHGIAHRPPCDTGLCGQVRM